MSQWDEWMEGKTFITDLGCDNTEVIDGEPTVIGRYAVWSPVSGGGHHRVIEVGHDLAALMSKYGIPPERVCTAVQ